VMVTVMTVMMTMKMKMMIMGDDEIQLTNEC